ncbi:MAG: hypothetical protein ACEPOZ_17660 [Marinifilaceae bacterium]
MNSLDFLLLLFRIIELYLFLGLVFLIYFYTKGLSRLDKATEGTSTAFKLLIAPGTLLLWPLLLLKIIKTSKHEPSPKEKTSN